MLLSIIGNIGVGKTTYINEIKKISKYKKFKIIALDDYRHKYNKKNTLDGEEKAQLALIKDLEKHSNVILESSGTGKWYKSYLQAYQISHDQKINVILLKDTSQNCLLKHNQRILDGYKLPPFPYNIPIEDGIEWIGNQLDGFGIKNIITVTKDINKTFDKIKKKL